MHRLTRRTVLKQSIAAAALAAGETFARGDDRQPAIRLGGPVFEKSKEPEALALGHRKLGYRAAYCPPVGLDQPEAIRDFTAAYAKHDVVIAEVGRWVNMLDADAAKRAENIKKVTDGLALAEALAARCCVDIAGSFNEKVWYGPHPKNFSPEFFDAAVENARKIIDAVKPKRAKFCYEMMGWALPDTPDAYLRLIKAIDRPGFGVHLDVCNAVNSPEKFYNNAALIDECFDKLGAHIVSCHAKDLTWDVEMNVHFREVVIGKGEIDYTRYLKRLAALPGDVPLMIEHMKGPEEYDASRQHVFAVGKKNGVRFE